MDVVSSNVLPTFGVYICCRDRAQVRDNALRHNRLAGKQWTINFWDGYDSYYEYMRDVFAEKSCDYVLLMHDDVILPARFPRLVEELIGDLQGICSNWGIVGNAGVSFDGKHAWRFVADPHGGPGVIRNPVAVSSVDGNLMLINRRELDNRGVEVPELEGFHAYDLLLCLEASRAGLINFVDRRLFAIHQSKGGQAGFDQFVTSESFQQFWVARFKDRYYDSLNGRLTIVRDENNASDMRIRTDEPTERRGEGRAPRMGTLECARRAIRETLATRPLSLDVICRTEAKRPHSLQRMIDSVSMAAGETALNIGLLLVVENEEAADAVRAQIEKLDPSSLRFEVILFGPDRPEVNRITGIIAGIAATQANYVLFLDDDDFIWPGAFKQLELYLFPPAGRIIVCNTWSLEEEWIEFPNAFIPKQLSYPTKRSSYDLAHCWNGDNYVPICGAVYPSAVLTNFADKGDWDCDYYEDYNLIMMAIANADDIPIPVDIDLAGISIRKNGSTVGEQVRSYWDQNRANVLSNLLENHAQRVVLGWNLLARNPMAHETSIIASDQTRNNDAINQGHHRDREISNLILQLAIADSELNQQRKGLSGPDIRDTLTATYGKALERQIYLLANGLHQAHLPCSLIMFDEERYARTYPEVVIGPGTPHRSYTEHWIEVGYSEGKRAFFRDEGDQVDGN